jgi:acetylglutamate kinase
MQKPILLKIGGSSFDHPEFVDDLAAVVKQIDYPLVIVHGGGRLISDMQRQLGIQPYYIDGLRVSDPESLAVAEMVLCGAVNTQITRAFVLAGIEAQGLNGMDRGLLRAEKLEHPEHDLGRVGIPTTVRSEILLQLLAEKVVPVIAPICLGDDGPFNVNADHVARAIGKALGVKRVVFLTNVSGVFHEGEVVPFIYRALGEELIAQKVIRRGMRVKVQSALELIDHGVEEVLITDLEGLLTGAGTIIFEEIQQEPTGTDTEKVKHEGITDADHNPR